MGQPPPTDFDPRPPLRSLASLDHLIAMKEAAGRPKDRLTASEYRALSDELRGPPAPDD